MTRSKIYMFFLFFIFLVSCNTGVETLQYELSTKIIIENFKGKYGFEEITLAETTDSRFPNRLVIECKNSKNLPTKFKERKILMRTIANEIFQSLDSATRKRILAGNIFLTNQKMFLLQYERFESCDFGIFNDKINIISCSDGKGSPVRKAVKELKRFHGFKEIKPSEENGNSKHTNHIVIDCIIGTELPSSYAERKLIMNAVANKIYLATNEENQEQIKIEGIHVFLTNDSSTSEPETCFYRIVEGKVVDDYCSLEK